MSSAETFNSPSSPLDSPLTPRASRILSLLPEEEYQRLLPRMEMLPFKLRDVFYKPNEPIHHLYFPITCVGSLIKTLRDGSSVEFGTVGNEGFIGLPILFGTGSDPSLAICQVPGEIVRMRAEVIQEERERRGPLHALLLRYAHYLFNQMAQTATCNRMHPIEERCSRWLLMTHDRVGKDEFGLTQEFLATMLGVRRATVTVAAGILQEAGFIKYSRGRIAIVDRESLEESSCECYRIIRDAYEAIMGQP